MTRKKDFEREHPSYGMLHIHRMHNSSSRRLFGSALENHYNTIRLSVGTGMWYHELNADRYYSGSRGELIEIEMSAAQFAEAITSMNVGGGTPCTVRYVNGERVPDPPDHKTEVEHVREEFENNLGEYVEKMKEYRKEVDELTASLPAKRRERLRIALDCMIQQLSSNIPFVLSQFEEATSRVVTSAKAEVESFLTHAVQSAGLDAIKQGALPPLLNAPDEEEEE